MWWIDNNKAEADSYGAFRAVFEMAEAGEIEIRTLGATCYTVWLDGGYAHEGPSRYPASHPEFDTRRLRLKAGRHVGRVRK
jgi:hypothetical protein